MQCKRMLACGPSFVTLFSVPFWMAAVDMGEVVKQEPLQGRVVEEEKLRKWARISLSIMYLSTVW